MNFVEDYNSVSWDTRTSSLKPEDLSEDENIDYETENIEDPGFSNVDDATFSVRWN